MVCALFLATSAVVLLLSVELPDDLSDMSDTSLVLILLPTRCSFPEMTDSPAGVTGGLLAWLSDTVSDSMSESVSDSESDSVSVCVSDSVSDSAPGSTSDAEAHAGALTAD